MITPRTTRLVRVADLQTFRDAAVALACGGAPVEARDRLLIVPTRAAAAYFVRAVENRLPASAPAALLPDAVTRHDLHERLAHRHLPDVRMLTAPEREVLLGAACRAAAHADAAPPFRVRPGLVAEMVRFYDSLRRNQKDITAFERLALGALEPQALDDRGAERLVRQTRFLASAFRRFEEQCDASGALDEHALARRLIATSAASPWRHVLVTVGDHAFDPHGLYPADWDLLGRLPGLERIDVIVTDAMIAGAFHERIHQLLPGIEEVRFPLAAASIPVLLCAPGGGLTQTARDRDEEVAGFARWVRDTARQGDASALDRIALVVRRPLPYVYLARELLRSAGIPCQMFDALPLAAEPYAAALDLVFSFISTGFGREASVGILRSPHLAFRHVLSEGDLNALDEALRDTRYAGDVETLDAVRLPGAAILAGAIRELEPLRSAASCARHLSLVTAFLAQHAVFPDADDPLRERHLRARSAVLGTLVALRDASARFDSTPVAFDEVIGIVRRWVDEQTFAPRTGESGLHIVDAASAPFGDFDAVQIAGLVDGEWPEPPHRTILYSPGLLRGLGWPADADRRAGARAAFRDLLRLPSHRLVVSTFTLENDAPVAPSSLVDELDGAGLEAVEYTPAPVRIFEDEALGIDPIDIHAVGSRAQPWAAVRLAPARAEARRFEGRTRGHAAGALALSALERYQDCPFKFFAADVLRLDEPAEDELLFSPRARGRFIHQVCQRFFAEWDSRGAGAITPDRLDDARALFESVATELLALLPPADATLERTRLFGSAISVGVVDVILGLEASRPAQVRERWLEYRLEGTFSLGVPGGRAIPLKGVADRIDLLEGGRLRVIDYKSGAAPNPKRALQVPIYALCAQERLASRDGREWIVDEAAYVAFAGKRQLVPVVRSGGDATEPLTAARQRLFAAADGIAAGDFPPRPHDPMICSYCAYARVCRKDYVEDD